MHDHCLAAGAYGSRRDLGSSAFGDAIVGDDVFKRARVSDKSRITDENVALCTAVLGARS
jgi:hypothetical protein